jgi:simple sugar transport system substrate-binding protein
MKTSTKRLILLCFMVVCLVVSGASSAVTRAADELVIGYVLVGPQNDHGWSEAQDNAFKYVMAKVPGVKTVFVDKLNSADRPNITLEQVVSDFKDQGAKLIFTTSDDFGPDTLKVAEKFPELTFMHVSGDGVLKGVAPKNVGNVMGKMEYMKMVAGCAAALKTQTGSIAYLGPLVNDETRRLVASVYLGAKYCYQEYRKEDPAKLKFEVKWIGFWFNISGVTLDPTEVANGFFNGGADVIISGIDTPEGITVAKQHADKGEKVFAVSYDYENGCDTAPGICLGVPYFNWGPSYVQIVKDFMAGTWKQSWDWIGPDWKDINNPDTSIVGFKMGDALSTDEKATLAKFEAGMGDGSINLFKGPLNYQDGSVFLKDGETATDNQIWYLSQLLEGMKGESKASK